MGRTLLTGKIIAERYMIGEYISRGGSSEIYMVKDRQSALTKSFAIKCIRKHGDPGQIRQFREEMALLDKLSHPNMSSIRDFLEDTDYFYIVMDFVNGYTLREKIEKTGPLSETETIETTKTICKVLEYLHTTGVSPIVFCDMNPKNVMIDEHGIPRLIDFGIAQEGSETRRSQAPPLGTRGFAAPEQYRTGSRIITPKTDVFGLGATIFFMLTGNTYSESKEKDPAEFGVSVSPALTRIIRKCLEEDPKDRYQNISELKKAISDMQKYNDSYLRDVRRKITLCVSGMLAAAILTVGCFVSWSAMTREMKTAYQNAVVEGQQLSHSGERELAKKAYLDAISIDPDETDAYIQMFYALLPEETEVNAAAQARSAVDAVRYVSDAALFKDEPEFLEDMIQELLSMNEPVYQNYGVELTKVLSKNRSLKGDDARANRVDAYGKIFNYTTEGEDGNVMMEAAASLIQDARGGQLSDEECLENYYTALTICAMIPDAMPGETGFDQIGEHIRQIESRNLTNEDFGFRKTISLHVRLAGCYYRQYCIDKSDRALLDRANEWISSVQGAVLESDTYIQHGKILTELENYDAAKVAFGQVLAVSEDSNALLGMITACIEEQSANGLSDFSEALVYYKRLASKSDLSTSTLNQLNALRIRMGV